MKQTSEITQAMTRAQEAAANRPAFNTPKTLYRLYTQRLAHVDVAEYVGRYFQGATILQGVGLDTRTQEQSEDAIVIEIVSSASDALQRAADLAGDLRVAGSQVSVLLTVQDIRTFEITEPSVKDSPTINLQSKAQAHRFSGLA